ncbi:unnamed protein product [Ectocarpus sp. 13 AM-2016]
MSEAEEAHHTAYHTSYLTKQDRQRALTRVSRGGSSCDYGAVDRHPECCVPEVSPYGRPVLRGLTRNTSSTTTLSHPETTPTFVQQHGNPLPKNQKGDQNIFP